MHRYQDALHHLNLALDAMIEQGDNAAIANIVAAITQVQGTIVQRRTEIIAGQHMSHQGASTRR